MINNSYFDTKLDSIAASSKSMDTTNFYSEIYPLLKNVKAKGIQIVCTGGDKSLINVKYSPEDSITFFASAMANTNADSINYVIVFNYNKNTNELTSKFVRLDKVEKKKQDTTVTTILNTEKLLTKVWQGPSSKTINILAHSSFTENLVVQIYSIRGILCYSGSIRTNEPSTIKLNNTGIYIVKTNYSNASQVNKIIVF